MTTEQFWQKFNKLKEAASKHIDERAVHLLNSGAIDLEAWDDDYLLPKVILASCLGDAAENLRPLSEEGKRELANLRKF